MRMVSRAKNWPSPLNRAMPLSLPSSSRACPGSMLLIFAASDTNSAIHPVCRCAGRGAGTRCSRFSSMSFQMSILEGAKTSTDHLAWPPPEGGSLPPDPIGHIGSMDSANWLIYRTPGDGDECANGLDADAHVCGRGRRSSAITSRAQDMAFARACRPNSSCRFICGLSANDQDRGQIAMRGKRASRRYSGAHRLQHPVVCRLRHVSPRHISRTITVDRS